MCFAPDYSIIHVIYGAHVTNPYYVNFNINDLINGNIKTLEAQEWNIKITYPQFYTIKDELYLVFRNDNFENDIVKGTIKITKFNEIENKWDLEEAKILFHPGEDRGIYIHDIAINGNLVAIPYMFRLENYGTNIVENDGIYLTYSDDYGKTFKDINGKISKMPIYKNNSNKLIDLKIGSSLMNQDGSTFSKDGILYFTYINEDKQGVPQIHLSIVDLFKKSIKTHVVSQNSIKFTLEGKGTLVLPISRSEVAISKKYIHVIYRQNGKMIIASAGKDDISDSNNKWNYYIPFPDDLGAWEPNIDIEAWKNEERLLIFIQNVKQAEGDKNFDFNPTNIFIAELIEDVNKR